MDKDSGERKHMEKDTLFEEGLKKSTKEEKTWEAVIEAVLFTMGNSVELSRLAVAIGQDENTAREAVLRLKKRFDTGKRGMQIIELENSYQMCTRTEY
jgi:segregation and condensation protein B